MNVDEGKIATFGFNAEYSGTSTQPIVAVVAVDGKRYRLNGTPAASGKSYAVSLKTIPFAEGGKTVSTVTFRLCTTSSCNSVYPGSTSSFTVNLDVRLKDWATFQRDAAHSGYVAVKYDAVNFASAWTMPVSANDRITGIAATRGSLFVNLAPPYGSQINLQTRAIDSGTGGIIWDYDLGNKNYYSAPSYSNGRVVSAAMDISSGNIPIDVIDAKTGRYLRSLSYSSQFANSGTPTPFDDELYLQAGYYGNVVFGYNSAMGTRRWVTDTTQINGGYVQEGESVAADARFVYFFSSGYLVALNRSSGEIAHNIRNPFFGSVGLSYYGSYFGAPILDGTGRVFTFSDNRPQDVNLPLVAFSIKSDSVLWRTKRSYGGEPALRDGKLYAIRADSRIIDIIDTADGSVDGSINLGSGVDPLNSNLVLTESHLFVANDSKTYAIDIQNSAFPTVWSADQGGSLAITPDNVLVISSRTRGLYAYRLSGSNS
ncbi:PQQ-binding-like beta-propeller repeat protein [Novosphingopyxis sp.]|uniref:outer membrane protein assembly factor BamB family protein n=1 Tax=Novosphingopyxis sp. TaxID=2709690 RepID=UPI003B5CBA47